MQTFTSEAVSPDNPKWEACIKRENSLYDRGNDIRDEAQRDYTRLLHCQAFSRLKHKTQVFFAPTNDHVCTRMEHSLHVASVAQTVARTLGLNESLAQAIAIGHDIGHSPFGHHGEDCLNALLMEDAEGKEKERLLTKGAPRPFWHERNSLFFADYIECLADPAGRQKLLDLTYAVRDGIICHCGEIDQQGLRPRDNVIDLYSIKKPGAVAPFTWEGCVVRVADKISFLGRDIEDARTYHILDMGAYRELREIVTSTLGMQAIDSSAQKSSLANGQGRAVNTTVLINDLIVDLCQNSSPEKGLCFSPRCFDFLSAIRVFNLKRIYNHWRLAEFKKYASLVLGTLYHTLMHLSPYVETGRTEQSLRYCPRLCSVWEDWLIRHTNYCPRVRPPENKNKKLDAHEALRTDAPRFFDVHDRSSYRKCVIEFISGMTDQFAIRAYEEIIAF